MLAACAALSGCAATGLAPIQDRTAETAPAALPAEEPAVSVMALPETAGEMRAEPLPEDTAPQMITEDAPPPPNSAVVALLDNADQQSKGGRLDAAAAALERALRLEPHNAEVWSRLAEIRLQQGQVDQAASLAAKSNNLAGNNVSVLARNWKTIAQARSRKGDLKGAREAQAKVLELEGAR
ncbi:MAG: tetratricopeptide repeat protein [Gammaproteobacteria bacterium]|nr:tetratricopeptide repeat protein [Gammaproteobacteria bacterium]